MLTGVPFDARRSGGMARLPKTRITLVPKADGSFLTITHDAPVNETRQARRMRERAERKNLAKQQHCSQRASALPRQKVVTAAPAAVPPSKVVPQDASNPSAADTAASTQETFPFGLESADETDQAKLLARRVDKLGGWDKIDLDNYEVMNGLCEGLQFDAEFLRNELMAGVCGPVGGRADAGTKADVPTATAPQPQPQPVSQGLVAMDMAAPVDPRGDREDLRAAPPASKDQSVPKPSSAPSAAAIQVDAEAAPSSRAAGDGSACDDGAARCDGGRRDLSFNQTIGGVIAALNRAGATSLAERAMRECGGRPGAVDP